MKRFEIEDLISQDSQGVVFRAFNKRTEKSVALRRFFPFGKGGDGLDHDEAAAFQKASERLAKVQNPALRSVVFGSVDPIDGIPFLVTEWVDGDPLSSILVENKLEIALVLDVVRMALESSILISKSLGQEAVWVETETSSIIVGNDESGRGFTFWISPLKWLGIEGQAQGLTPIVDLAEELTGWKNQIVADRAGFGLGGWLRWLKANPGTSLGEALEALNSTTAKAIALAQPENSANDDTGTTSFPPAVTQPVAPAQPAAQDKHRRSRLPLVLAALVALLGTAAFMVTRQQSRVGDTLVVEKSAPAKKEVEAPDADADQDQQDDSEMEDEPQKTKAEADAPKLIPNDEGKIEVTPVMGKELREFPRGTPVVLTGKLNGFKFSDRKTKNTLYLNFINSKRPEAINGIAHKKDFEGLYAARIFEKFKGKEVTVDGLFFIEITGRSYVKIKSVEQVKLK